MKKIITLLILLMFAILVSGCVQQGQNNPPPSGNEPNAVIIKDFAFSPSTLTVNAGATVTWTNQDSAAHKVTSDSGTELDSASFSQGQTYSHTFSTPGTFEYHCGIHTSMKGKVVVE